jgi:glyoxylase-like metal-dependent hydrolase (beta-lactamase superfamily II)
LSRTEHAPAPAGTLEFPWAEPPEPGGLRAIAPGLLWLRLPLPYRLNHVNIYLIAEAGGMAVVDTGLGDATTRDLWRAVLEGPLAGQRITRVIATHFHPDHVGLAGWFCETFGIPLYMPRSEYLFSLALQYAPGDRGGDLYRQFYRSHGLADQVIEEVLSNGHEYLRRTTGVPSVYRRLAPGQDLTLGDRVFQVMTGGGHAMEQAMLHCATEKLFLSADQVIAQISPNISVHAMEPRADSLGDYLTSLRALIADIPDDVLVLPGHGLPFRGLHARARALIAHHDLRCGEIAQACAGTPRSAADLIPVVFRRVLDAHQTGFAFGEVLAHVNHMLAQGVLHHAEAPGGIERYLAA